VYLEQAIYTELTRVQSDGWHQAGMEQSFGFKVYSAARDGQAGTIRFTDCRADDNLYGI
jgi:hypothetical protein